MAILMSPERSERFSCTFAISKHAPDNAS
jgi:hypothetical protein